MPANLLLEAWLKERPICKGSDECHDKVEELHYI
jgi:hypothetical protein